MKKTIRRMGILAVAAALSAAGAFAPSSADACMRTKMFRPQAKTKAQKVRDAERLLAKGNNKRALARAKQLNRQFVQARRAAADAPILDRAQRTIALATVRTGGAVNLGRGLRGKSPFEQQVNVAWAVAVLQVQAARDPDNLVVRTAYAEALSHSPGQSSYAFDLLNELDKQDLMPTARGYALLASLQAGMGDTVGRDRSISRCRDLGADPSLCGVA